MKKVTLVLSALVASLAINAEVFTLDLAHPTNPESITYTEDNIWTETWNEAEQSIDFQIFSFSHIPSGDSYGGTSWEGFTISKATKDGTGDYDWFSNMAKGGLAGEGTPYIFAYYSEYWTVMASLYEGKNEDNQSSNLIFFNDGNAYYPRYVYINNSLISYKNVTAGGGAARAFEKGDKFILRIQGLDDEYYHDITDDENRIEYLMADYTSDDESEWFVNTDWVKVDLSALGQVYGLAFTMVSTDQSIYGTNTATYFALDGLTVSSTPDEDIPSAINNVEKTASAQKVVRDGQIYILRNGVMYNVNGAAVK